MGIKLVKAEYGRAGSLRTYQYDRLGMIDVGFSKPKRKGDAVVIRLPDLHCEERFWSPNYTAADKDERQRAAFAEMAPTAKRRRKRAAAEPAKEQRRTG